MSDRCNYRAFSTAQSDEFDSEEPKPSVKVIKDGSAVVIAFPNEDSSSSSSASSLYHANWLWSNDPTFVHASSRQRLRSPGEYNGTRIKEARIISSWKDTVELNHEKGATTAVVPSPPPFRSWCHPVSIEQQQQDEKETEDDCNLLCIQWDDSTSSISYYDLGWLRHWRYDDEALEKNRRVSQVTKQHAITRRIEGSDVGIPSIEYSDLLSEGSNAVFELLHAIVQHGAALVTNAPTNNTHDDNNAPVGIVGKLLGGWLSHGALYDDIFHVQSVPNAHNIAYTSVALRPHQDLAYYESVPGLQLLHCVNNHGVQGGESVLVDALAAAHEFRKIAPEYFHILTKCPATFCKQRDNANMVYRRPHIVVSGSSNDEIVTVNWSPPFEGPLSVRTDMVEPYYEAYAAFECMLDNKFVRNTTQQTSKLFQELADYANEYTWERKLQEGQMLVFNNRRMLHARRSFELLLEEEGATDGKVVGRHLVGCYTNIDDTLSRYRVLLQQRLSKDEPFSLLNVGNGSPAVN